MNLTRQHYQILHPTFNERRVVRNKIKLIPRPLFVNYLFVHIDLDAGQRWVPIRHTFGVSKLLTRQSSHHEFLEPCVIPDTFISQLQACSEGTGEPGCVCLKPGVTIKILRGPFAGHHGIIEWSDHVRCRLLLHLLNRNVPLSLAVEDVVEV